jgi:voltage-gated potassium channel Kch
LVKFTAPLVSIASIVLLIAANARDGLANYFLRFYRGHKIVVGLGEKSYQFLQTCEKKSHFVVVERNPNNGFIARTRAMGVKVVTRDIAEDGLFDRLALTHAESFIIFTNSDAENVEVALKLRQHLRLLDRRKLRLRVHIHLDDFALAHQLENYSRFSTDQSTTEGIGNDQAQHTFGPGLPALPHQKNSLFFLSFLPTITTDHPT